ncbi:MAG: 2-oxo acid dehydrogenase subunit E2 [Deltaproteobacteria bacterium]|nr:2-oxo acid dehydrogenase subunit E2 [Deltaproteobacteria bacterium]
MAFEFKLPDIGEGVVEGELTKWLVQDGQEVQEDTPLFEVLTDKVSAVIPSPRPGKIAKRHFAEGDMVPVGSVVVTILEAGQTTATAPAAAPVPAQVPAQAQVPVPAPAPVPAPVPAPAPVAAPVPAPVPVPVPDAAQRDPGERVRAAPATRKLARELGIDLFEVPGTGDEGRVTQADVQAWAARVAGAPSKPAAAPALTAPIARPAPQPLPPGQDETREKLKGLRKRIHQRMRMAKDNAAHFTYVDEVDFTAVNELRAALEPFGLKATFLPFVIKAVCLALKKPQFAYLNASLDDAAGEIVVKHRYHIGVAAATEAGLVVPVVKDADRLSLKDLISEVKRLGEGARTASLPGEDMAGSTFTITSLGKIGGMFATPIVNYPEVAILGLHKVEKRPVVVNDQIVIRERMYMSCSFDHRLIDGHVGAAFVQAVKDYLENPALLIAELV